VSRSRRDDPVLAGRSLPWDRQGDTVCIQLDCGGTIRTCDLRVMSPTRTTGLLHPASCFPRDSHPETPATQAGGSAGSPREADAFDGICTRDLHRDRVARTLASPRRQLEEDQLHEDRSASLDRTGRRGVAPRMARFGDVPGPGPRPVKRTAGVAPAPGPWESPVLLLHHARVRQPPGLAPGRSSGSLERGPAPRDCSPPSAWQARRGID
jgi:hypothetical protein